jgi:hypothetical protein
LTGNIVELDVEKTANIEEVKKAVQEKTGIPPPQQRLIYGGKAMCVLSQLKISLLTILIGRMKKHWKATKLKQGLFCTWC